MVPDEPTSRVRDASTVLARADRRPRLAARAAIARAVEDDTMTPLQAAKVLGVSRPMIYQFIRDGLLEDRLVGTHHRIPAGSVHQRVQSARERVRARRAARQA